MVKKLLKQEIAYYIRSLLPVYVILISISVLGRGIHLFESDTWAYSVIGNSSLAAYGMSVFAAMGLGTIFIIIRYYKNMFTGEGYLTLTLPVSASQHLRAKLLASMIVTISTMFLVMISLVIFLGGEWIVEICKAVDYLTKDVIAQLGGNFAIYVVEAVILFLAAMIMEILIYYMCISIGQTFQKRRILIAIVIYYAIYLVTQVVVTVLNIAITVVMDEFQTVSQWILNHYQGVIHACLLGGIIFSVGVSIIIYLICCYILRKRLNLE